MASNENEETITVNGDSKRPIYRNLEAGDVEELELSEVESLCMECEKQGTTRLMLTRIPLFREIILMSFHCPHCGNSNNEIQDGSTIPDEGVKYTIQVKTAQDLNRMVVKANSASLLIPKLEFEIPPKTQTGSINTLEGFLTLSMEGLQKDQPARKSLYPEVYEKLENFILKMKDLLEVKSPFTVVLDDPSGNSFVENKMASEQDPQLQVEHYTRTPHQDALLGVIPATNVNDSGISEETQDTSLSKDEILAFQETCPNCRNSVESRMKLVDIPHFKEVILMSLACDFCGFKSNEVKSGGGISDQGTKITLHMTDPTDLSRDILKAETAALLIPELEFELQSGTLGGRFTTVEGLLVNVKDQLSGANAFSAGDSATEDDKLAVFLKRLQKIIDGDHLGVHIILDDPAGNSYVQNLYAPDDDPEMKVERYMRSFEQNEDLGINQMKTENY